MHQGSQGNAWLNGEELTEEDRSSRCVRRSVARKDNRVRLTSHTLVVTVHHIKERHYAVSFRATTTPDTTNVKKIARKI